MSTDVDIATPIDDLSPAEKRDLYEKVCAIHTDIAQTRELIERVMTEVMPTIESLSNSPMGKMFLKGLGS